MARVNFRALNESNQPLSGVSVRLVFCAPQDHRAVVYVEGSTDTKGLFSGQGYTDYAPGMDLKKEGYYSGVIPFPPFTNAVNQRWEPWDATYSGVFRKIENPIPMYARIAVVKVPVQNKPCGYDLKEGDWVAPWGKGLVSDFVFTMSWDFKDFVHQDNSMKLTFSNPLDGIQPANLRKEFSHSAFIWDRQSPEAGYVGHYEMEFGVPNKGFRIPSAPQIKSGEQVDAQKFYFRVRTIEKDGKIVSALYGKLSQGISIGAMSATNAHIRIYYYLNPTPLDRNMEFDMEKNLFKGLNPMEQPRQP